MTEQEFEELTKGNTVMTSLGAGVVKYITEHGAGVDLGGGIVLNFCFEYLDIAGR